MNIGKTFFYFTSIYTEQGELLWSRIPGFDHEKYVAERKEASKNGGSYSSLRTLTEENQKVYGLIGDRNKSYNANSMPIFGKFIVLGDGLNAENSESIKYDLTFYTNLSAFEEHDIN